MYEVRENFATANRQVVRHPELPDRVESKPGTLGRLFGFILIPLDWIVEHHRSYGTHYQGPTCPMYPGCSAYYQQSRNRPLGFRGFFLTLDRLFFREFGRLDDKYFLAPEHLSEGVRFYDPLDDSIGIRPSFTGEDFSR